MGIKTLGLSVLDGVWKYGLASRACKNVPRHHHHGTHDDALQYVVISRNVICRHVPCLPTVSPKDHVARAPANFRTF